MPARATTTSALAHLFAQIANWIRAQAAARRAALELDACGTEVDRIAYDVGLSTYELRRLVRHAPCEAELLHRRMAMLHLDSQDVAGRDGVVMRDLQWVCTQCASRRRCAGALARGTLDDDWRRYCPNAGTLSVLQARWPSASI